MPVVYELRGKGEVRAALRAMRAQALLADALRQVARDLRGRW